MSQQHNHWSSAWLSQQLRAAAPLPDVGLAQIYRNTAWRGWIDALTAQYPSISGHMGDEWAQAAARLFLQQHPPRSPVMLDIGQAYPDFLRTFEHAAQWPWLGDVAQADWLWSRAHVAADAPVLDQATWLGAIGRAQTTVLQLHPSCHWHWCEQAPVAQLWHIGRARISDAQPTWHGQGIVFTRPYGDVLNAALTTQEWAFLQACAAGQCLSQAVVAALATPHNASNPDTPELDLSAFSAKLLRLGIFSNHLNQITPHA